MPCGRFSSNAERRPFACMAPAAAGCLVFRREFSIASVFGVYAARVPRGAIVLRRLAEAAAGRSTSTRWAGLGLFGLGLAWIHQRSVRELGVAGIE